MTTLALTANDPGFTDYTVDMATLPTWVGVIKQLRIDPLATLSSGEVIIDSIALSDRPPSIGGGGGAGTGGASASGGVAGVSGSASTSGAGRVGGSGNAASSGQGGAGNGAGLKPGPSSSSGANCGCRAASGAPEGTLFFGGLLAFAAFSALSRRRAKE